MLRNIQSCRAVAALLVVFFHAAGNLAKAKYFGALASPLEKLFAFGGTAGVAFFFVLSGFIIHHVHHQDLNRPGRLPRYLSKRLIRIYPTYWILFIGVWALARLTPSLQDSLPTDPFVLLKSLLLLPQDAAVVGGTGAPVLAVAWSLQYEMVFYATFALGLISRRLFVAILAVAFVHIALAPIFGPYGFPGRFFASPYILLFLFGMLASRLDKMSFRFPLPGTAASVAASLFLLVGLVAKLTRSAEPIPGFELAYGGLAAILIVSLARHERQSGVRAQSRIARVFARVFALLGDASYSLYLIHFPLIAILSRTLVAMLPKTFASACVAFVLMVVICAAVSAAFYTFIERPILRRLMNSKRAGQAEAFAGR